MVSLRDYHFNYFKNSKRLRFIGVEIICLFIIVTVSVAISAIDVIVVINRAIFVIVNIIVAIIIIIVRLGDS